MPAVKVFCPYQGKGTECNAICTRCDHWLDAMIELKRNTQKLPVIMPDWKPDPRNITREKPEGTTD